MKIHIFGASGSGVSTLTENLGEKLGWSFFDADYYYWEPTQPPFQIRRNPTVRNQMLLNSIQGINHWILGGSIDTWGTFLHHEFDLLVYLWLPAAIRKERLLIREEGRYGLPLPQSSLDFIDWALDYDSNNRPGRSKLRHENWIFNLDKPIIRIEIDLDVSKKIQIILDYIRGINSILD